MTTPSSPRSPRPITAQGETVLRVMQRRPLDWWYMLSIDAQVEGRFSLVTVLGGMAELEANGLITERWEPRPGETEEEAQQAVAEEIAVKRVAHAAERAAWPWWKWLWPPAPAFTRDPANPPRRKQFRLTDRGRGTMVKLAVKASSRHPLGQPLMPGLVWAG